MRFPQELHVSATDKDSFPPISMDRRLRRSDFLFTFGWRRAPEADSIGSEGQRKWKTLTDQAWEVIQMKEFPVMATP